MSAFLIAVATLLVLAVVVAALPLAYAGVKRIGKRDADLEIWRVMGRLGISGEAALRNDAKMAHAIRRCVMCASLDECDHWLASGKTDGIDQFCPNAGVLEELQKR